MGWVTGVCRRGGETKTFGELIKTLRKNDACRQNLTFFFRPPLAVNERERLRGLDGARDGRGASGGRCHDGEGINEVSSFLVFNKILVNTPKIQLLPSNFCI